MTSYGLQDSNNVTRGDENPPARVFEEILNIANRIEDTDSDMSIPERDFLSKLEEVALDTEFDYDHLFLDGDDVPEELGEIGYGSKQSYKPVIENVDHLQFCGFTAKMLYYIREDQGDNASDLYKKFGGEFDKDAYEPYIIFFESYVVQNNQYDPELDDISSAISSCIKAINRCPTHYLVYLNAAEAIVQAYEYDRDINPDLDSDRDDLVGDSLKYANRATSLCNDFSRGHLTKAHAAILNEEFDDALEAIDDATRIEQDDTKPSDVDQLEIDRINQKYLIHKTSHDAEEDISNIYSDVKETKDDIDGLESRFETTVSKLEQRFKKSVDKFRSNSIQFIGFFAAIITLSVTSSNIVVNANRSLIQDAGLITVLTGGLLVGFGAFGLLLPYPNTSGDTEEFRSSRKARVVGILFIGTVLMAAGWIVSYILV